MNDKIKIAIIGGSSGDALVETCKNMGYYSIMFCGRETDRGYGSADENYLIDLSETSRIVNIIKEKSDCLLLGTGHTYAHNIAKVLYDDGFVVSINPHKAEYGKNKVLAYEFIRSIGYKTPDYLVISDVNQFNTIKSSIKLPCVVKSENDAVRTAKANDEKHLNELIEENLRTKNKVIVEQFIDGIEYTIPVISDGETFVALTDALNMADINKIAVAHLRYFDDLDKKYDRFEFLDDKLRDKIADTVIDITKKMGLIGVPRYDLMVGKNAEIYILEVNEVAVSRIGSAHYPWETVNISMSDEMVKNTVKLYNKKKQD